METVTRCFISAFSALRHSSQSVLGLRVPAVDGVGRSNILRSLIHTRCLTSLSAGGGSGSSTVAASAARSCLLGSAGSPWLQLTRSKKRWFYEEPTRMRNHFRRPSEVKRIRRHGWETRLSTPSGRRILMRRILKGCHVLSH